MIISINWRSIISGVAIAIMLSSCATNNDGGKTTSVLAGTVLGATLGAGVGLLAGDPLVGAQVGAVVGLAASLIYNEYKVEQVKEALEVENDYKNEHEGKLPSETIITNYTARTAPSGLVRRGGELDLLSEIEVVKGKYPNTQKDRIEEELIIKSNLNELEPISSKKDVNIDSHNSGAYEMVFKFRPSEDLEQGHYSYKKLLYLNDKLVNELVGEFQVVMGGIHNSDMMWSNRIG